MNYATIKKTDVANGPGVRVSLFVSGCTHHCKGCFNSVAWDFQYGQAYTLETEQEILQALAPDYIRGLSLLGGEPMEPQNRATVLSLVKKVREIYPRKTIWCYTGYDFDKDLLAWMEAGDPVITKLYRFWMLSWTENTRKSAVIYVCLFADLRISGFGCTIVFKGKMWYNFTYIEDSGRKRDIGSKIKQKCEGVIQVWRAFWI